MTNSYILTNILKKAEFESATFGHQVNIFSPPSKWKYMFSILFQVLQIFAFILCRYHSSDCPNFLPVSFLRRQALLCCDCWRLYVFLGSSLDPLCLCAPFLKILCRADAICQNRVWIGMILILLDSFSFRGSEFLFRLTLSKA